MSDPNPYAPPQAWEEPASPASSPSTSWSRWLLGGVLWVAMIPSSFVAGWIVLIVVNESLARGSAPFPALWVSLIFGGITSVAVAASFIHRINSLFKSPTSATTIDNRGDVTTP